MDAPIKKLSESRICAHNGPLYPCNRPRRIGKDGRMGSRYCAAHQSRKQKGQPMDRPIQKRRFPSGICAHDGPKHPCNRPAVIKGYCRAHYQRQYKGKPMDVLIQNKTRSPKTQKYNGTTKPLKKRVTQSNGLSIPWWAEGFGLETLEFME